jgi:hypothetical protein
VLALATDAACALGGNRPRLIGLAPMGIVPFRAIGPLYAQGLTDAERSLERVRFEQLILAIDSRLFPGLIRKPTMAFSKIAVGIAGLVCLILSAHSAGAVEGGVFCISAGSYFVERPEPNGVLTFDVLESNAQGNIIEISGLAVPHKGGWRY